MSKKDHVFWVFIDDQFWWAFCKFDSMNKLEATSEVKKVLMEKIGMEDFSLFYVGYLSYEDMDPGIKEKLSLFEKYDPVWILKASV